MPLLITELRFFRHHKFPSEQFRLGKTKIFIKDPPQLFSLEEAREKKLPEVATIIQKHWKAALARMRFKRLKAAVRVQRALRSWKSRKWILLVIKTFAGVSRENNYGMDIAWPECPPASQLAQGISFHSLDLVMFSKISAKVTSSAFRERGEGLTLFAKFLRI